MTEAQLVFLVFRGQVLWSQSLLCGVSVGCQQSGGSWLMLVFVLGLFGSGWGRHSTAFRSHSHTVFLFSPPLFQRWGSLWCPSTAVTLSSSGRWRKAWTGPSHQWLERATGWMWGGPWRLSALSVTFVVALWWLLNSACCRFWYWKWHFSSQIDLSETLESWAAENITSDQRKVKPVWTDASFTLKYYSDALFDFPHWFGFSKRTFKVVCFFFPKL